jgi:hypothetical protein
MKKREKRESMKIWYRFLVANFLHNKEININLWGFET